VQNNSYSLGKVDAVPLSAIIFFMPSPPRRRRSNYAPIGGLLAGLLLAALAWAAVVPLQEAAPTDDPNRAPQYADLGVNVTGFAVLGGVPGHINLADDGSDSQFELTIWTNSSDGYALAAASGDLWPADCTGAVLPASELHFGARQMTGVGGEVASPGSLPGPLQALWLLQKRGHSGADGDAYQVQVHMMPTDQATVYNAGAWFAIMAL
jgi:hypothetical protein